MGIFDGIGGKVCTMDDGVTPKDIVSKIENKKITEDDIRLLSESTILSDDENIIKAAITHNNEEVLKICIRKCRKKLYYASEALKQKNLDMLRIILNMLDTEDNCSDILLNLCTLTEQIFSKDENNVILDTVLTIIKIILENDSLRKNINIGNGEILKRAILGFFDEKNTQDNLAISLLLIQYGADISINNYNILEQVMYVINENDESHINFLLKILESAYNNYYFDVFEKAFLLSIRNKLFSLSNKLLEKVSVSFISEHNIFNIIINSNYDLRNLSKSHMPSIKNNISLILDNLQEDKKDLLNYFIDLDSTILEGYLKSRIELPLLIFNYIIEFYNDLNENTQNMALNRILNKENFSDNQKEICFNILMSKINYNRANNNLNTILLNKIVDISTDREIVNLFKNLVLENNNLYKEFIKIINSKSLSETCLMQLFSIKIENNIQDIQIKLPTKDITYRVFNLIDNLISLDDVDGLELLFEDLKEQDIHLNDNIIPDWVLSSCIQYGSIEFLQALINEDSLQISISDSLAILNILDVDSDKFAIMLPYLNIPNTRLIDMLI